MAEVALAPAGRLAALTAGDPFGLAWLVRHAGATVGYVVVAQRFSREARGRGLQRLYLEVAHGNRAQDLYRRAGFRDRRRYLMSKDL